MNGLAIGLTVVVGFLVMVLVIDQMPKPSPLEVCKKQYPYHTQAQLEECAFWITLGKTIR